MTSSMIEMPAVIDESSTSSTISEFAIRLRASTQERAAILERERQLLHTQLGELRAKATIEPKRGWSMRRTA